MKLTKFQHACFVVEKEGTTIVVDLGTLAHDFIAPRRIDAIIVTHEHADHFDEAKVRAMLKTHPKATIIAHESISGRFTDFKTIAAKVGETYGVGSFSVQFFGGSHAPIADTVPTPANLGVLIDGHLYYPGDSFVVPEGQKVQELALPVGGPWLKASEAMQLLTQIRPTFVFPTHDATLSVDGKQMIDRLLGTVAVSLNAHYKRLDGTTVELV